MDSVISVLYFRAA